MTAVKDSRAIVDVEIGSRYLVAIGAHTCTVRIEARESSGVWLAFNEDTGRSLYVTFRDLGEQVLDGARPDPAPPPPVQPVHAGIDHIDHKRRASGERDDDE